MNKPIVIRLLISISLVSSMLAFACPSLSFRPDVYWVKFDEYSEISDREELARLKNLVELLRGWTGSVAYIVAWGGRNSCTGEARIRSERVRNFLTQQGIDGKRVRLIDAGHREKWVISLYTAPASVKPLTRDDLIEATLETNDLKVLKECKIKAFTHNRRRA
jgi:hypothetical protein